MKTFAKVIAALFIASFIGTTTVALAAPKMSTTTIVTKTHKKGYVHAHTFVKKNGTVVHVKGHYRHHPRTTIVKKTVKMGGKMGGMKMGAKKPGSHM